MKRGRTYTKSKKRLKVDEAQMQPTLKRNEEILEASRENSLRELAKVYGVSHQRIRQIINKMIKRRSLDNIAT